MVVRSDVPTSGRRYLSELFLLTTHYQLSLLRFIPIVGICCAPSPQTTQSTIFISHLTNSNGCGNIRAKVLLTVSLLRTLLFPQPSVYSQPSDFSGPLRAVRHAVSYSSGLFFSLGALFPPRSVSFHHL